MHHLRPSALPIAARHALRQAASSGDWAGPESAPANCRVVKTASTKAATFVETTAVEAVEAAVEAAEAAVEAAEAAIETAEAAMAAPAPRRHNDGRKHSKCCSRQQRDRDFTEHD